MEEKNIESMVNEEYVRVVAYYLKNKNIANILKHKCATLAAGGGYERIYIYTNSLQHMGSLLGHREYIQCLSILSNIFLASGSWDKSIKIWRLRIGLLCQHYMDINAK